MSHRFADIAFTPAVQELQKRYGSRAQYARMQASGYADTLGTHEAEFLAQADSFYLATVSETGWPYVQHRGGPRGFMKVLSPTQIGFADFRGNLQYVSAGNASRNDRVSIIVMDYGHKQRLKFLGHLRFLDLADADPALVRRMEMPDYKATVERFAIIDVAAFDWNCPQHITQRFTLEQVEVASRPLHERIAQLEEQLRTARNSGLQGNREIP
ncbi:MAG: pyridoxamine 5'-phosphate oxidase family protein [Prolixibacteraceae bacterium]|nr:pyridoxamine 5'-phosphate oxidase family protein [Burkholderiales bacterium]